jgi:toxin YoeB
MEIVYAPKAIKDLEFWKKSGNKSIQNKIQQIIDSIQETPFEGIGKPEPLKHNLSGKWSRRISHEHRVIYTVSSENEIHILAILSLKGHY